MMEEKPNRKSSSSLLVGRVQIWKQKTFIKIGTKFSHFFFFSFLHNRFLFINKFKSFLIFLFSACNPLFNQKIPIYKTKPIMMEKLMKCKVYLNLEIHSNDNISSFFFFKFCIPVRWKVSKKKHFVEISMSKNFSFFLLSLSQLLQFILCCADICIYVTWV